MYIWKLFKSKYPYYFRFKITLWESRTSYAEVGSLDNIISQDLPMMKRAR